MDAAEIVSPTGLFGNRSVDEIGFVDRADPALVTDIQPSLGPLPEVPQRLPEPAPPDSPSPQRPRQAQPSRSPTADPAQATRVADSIDGYAARFSHMMGGPPPRPRPAAPAAPPAASSPGEPTHHSISSDHEYELNNVGDTLTNFIEHANDTIEIVYTEA